MTFSLSVVGGAVAKAVEPPVLTWQAPPMVAPGPDKSDMDKMDSLTPIYLDAAGNFKWNSEFYSYDRTKDNYADATLTRVGAIDTKGLSAKQLSQLLQKCPTGTILSLQRPVPKATVQITIDELREVIKQRSAGNRPIRFYTEVGTINKSEDYRYARIINYGGFDISVAASLHNYATDQYVDGDAPPLDFQSMQIFRALQLADSAGYFQLSDD